MRYQQHKTWVSTATTFDLPDRMCIALSAFSDTIPVIIIIIISFQIAEILSLLKGLIVRKT